MIKERAKTFLRKIKDDSKVEPLQLNIFDEEESCEVFSICGINN